MTNGKIDELDVLERQLRILDAKGQCLIQVGLLVTVYFEGGHELETRLGVIQCMEHYVRTCGEHLSLALEPGKERWLPFSPEIPHELKGWLMNVDPESSWQLEYRGGVPTEATAFSARAFGVSSLLRKRHFQSFVRLTFPLTWFTEHGGSLIEHCLLCCEKLRPSSGYGGIGILQPAGKAAAFKTDPLVYAISRRFTGMEVDIPAEHAVDVSKGIKGVNWLTAISFKWLEKCGGIEAIGHLGNAIVVHPYKDGVVIQAGPRPAFGDTNRKERLEHYITVAKALRPIRIQTSSSFHNMGPGNRFTKETTVEWLQRFDKL